MKRYTLLYIAFVLLAVSFTSCEDMLTETPNSSYDKDGFFSTEAKAEMAVLGIYNSISDYRHYGWYEMASMASDDTYYLARTGSDNQIKDMVHYTVNPTNEWVRMLWLLKYQGIDRANMAIDGIENMSAYADSQKLKALDADIRSEFAAEISKGLEFRASKRVSSGFRISEKDGSGYIEISPDKCQELLYPYLSDSLKQMI